MTREEFIAGYCERSGVTWEWLSTSRNARPCNCREEGCDGWAMVSNDPEMIAVHDRLYNPPPSQDCG